MTNPRHPHLSPGRVKCHEVDEYCLTQVRYIVKNESMGKLFSKECLTN